MLKEKILRCLSYAALLFFVLTSLSFLTKELPMLQAIFRGLEVKTFDVRESILANIFKDIIYILSTNINI